MNLPPYLVPIDITKDGADEQIKKAGELARALLTFDLICLEHGIFAREVTERHVGREETRHRVGEHCWHEISIKNHEII